MASSSVKSVRLSDRWWAWAEWYAAKAGISRNAVVASAMEALKEREEGSR